MISETRLFDLLKAIAPDTKRLPPGMLIFARAVETEVQGRLTRERFEERLRDAAQIAVPVPVQKPESRELSVPMTAVPIGERLWVVPVTVATYIQELEAQISRPK